MEKLTFPNKEVAKIFADIMDQKGSIEKNKDGTVIFAYEKSEQEKVISAENLHSSINAVYRYVDNEYRYLSERINRLAKAFSIHKQNHLPSPATASQMSKAVKALGMEDDYDVKKKTIYIEQGDNSIEASYY